MRRRQVKKFAKGLPNVLPYLDAKKGGSKRLRRRMKALRRVSRQIRREIRRKGVSGMLRRDYHGVSASLVEGFRARMAALRAELKKLALEGSTK